MSEAFKIENQRPATRAKPGGGFVPVMEITFTTKPSGITGTVDVPDSAYMPDEVARLVGAKAALLEEVQAL